MMREGHFYPDHGIERIVAYHERQDERFAQAAAERSEREALDSLQQSYAEAEAEAVEDIVEDDDALIAGVTVFFGPEPEAPRSRTG